MKDFKSIDELNIFECYEIVKNGENYPFYDQVKTRFDQELENLKKEEIKHYDVCYTVSDLKKFLVRFDQYKPFYTMQYKERALDRINSLSRLNEEKSPKNLTHGACPISLTFWDIVGCICALFFVFVGVVMLFLSPEEWFGSVVFIIVGVVGFISNVKD